MECPFCKNEIKDDADYCEFCGEAITIKGEKMKEKGEIRVLSKAEKNKKKESQKGNGGKKRTPSFQEIFSKSWKIFTQNFFLIFGIRFFSYLPLVILVFLYLQIFGGKSNTLLLIVITTMEVIIETLIFGIMINIGNNPKNTISIRKILTSQLFKKTGMLFCVLVLISHPTLIGFPLSIVTGMIWFIIPLIVFQIMILTCFMFSGYGIFLKNQTIIGSLKYSLNINSGRELSLFGKGVLLGIITIPFALFLNLLIPHLSEIKDIKNILFYLFNISYSFITIFWTVLFLKIEKKDSYRLLRSKIDF